MQPDATGIKYQVFSIHKYINAKCFLLNKKCGFLKFFFFLQRDDSVYYSQPDPIFHLRLQHCRAATPTPIRAHLFYSDLPASTWEEKGLNNKVRKTGKSQSQGRTPQTRKQIRSQCPHTLGGGHVPLTMAKCTIPGYLGSTIVQNW